MLEQRLPVNSCNQDICSCSNNYQKQSSLLINTADLGLEITHTLVQVAKPQHTHLIVISIIWTKYNLLPLLNPNQK